MLKTNSKAVRQAVRDYIIRNCEDVIDLIHEDGQREDREVFFDIDFNRVANYIIETFEDNYNFPNDGKTIQDRFSYFAGCLPFDIFDYHNFGHSAVNLVGDILNQTIEERNRYTESQAESLMDYLIYSELTKIRYPKIYNSRYAR